MPNFPILSTSEEVGMLHVIHVQRGLYEAHRAFSCCRSFGQVTVFGIHVRSTL